MLGLTTGLAGVRLWVGLGSLLTGWRSGNAYANVDDPVSAGISELLTNPKAPHSEWSISETLAIELAGYLERVQPRRILEIGSGFSTAVLGAYAARHGAKVVSLEHEQRYHKLTTEGLAELALGRSVDLKLAPLRPRQFGNHEPYQWYDVALDGKFDFVFVDGPPKVMGRLGVFFAVRDHLRRGWQMWLDDGLRDHERKCVRLWAKEFPGEFSHTRRDIDGKGVVILRDAEGEPDRGKDQAILSHVGIGVLGNGDPLWWRVARRHIGYELLDSSYVVVAARDSAPASLPKFVNKHLPARGQGIQEMFRELARQPNVRYVLYLDDQWSLTTPDESWLWRALRILRTKPDIEQVSLRHPGDVNGEAARQVFVRPFDYEPSLLRADRLRSLFPTVGGRTPLRLIAMRSGVGPAPKPLQTEQLFPGVFRRNDHGVRRG